MDDFFTHTHKTTTNENELDTTIYSSRNYMCLLLCICINVFTVGMISSVFNSLVVRIAFALLRYISLNRFGSSDGGWCGTVGSDKGRL